MNDRFLNAVGLNTKIIKGVISISGIYSLHTPTTLPEHTCGWKNAIFHTIYVKSNFGIDQEKWHEASPIFHVKTSPYIPPFLVLNAERDLGLENGASTFVDILSKRIPKIQHLIVNSTSHATVTRSEATVNYATSFIEEIIAIENNN